MTSDTIDYPMMIDHAMRGVVRDALLQVQKSGLPGDHHFFISYRTDYAGVEMSAALRARFPEEITVVIQHQFWDLSVREDHFSVTLSFSNIPEKLVVPYAALTAFADPSIKFGLQFYGRQKLPEAAEKPEKAGSTKPAPALYDDSDEPTTGSAEIITLDAFRKK